MKRIIAVLLLIALSFSMLACAAPAPAAAPAETAPTAEPVPSKADLLYEKYSGILDALEAEDYDGAINAITSMKPIPTPAPVTKVDITLDNYLEYFEIIYVNRYDQQDANGNLINRQRFTCLKLKDQYLVDQNNPGEISFGVEYNEEESWHKGTDLDFETFTSSGKTLYKPNKSTNSFLSKSTEVYNEELQRYYLQCDLFSDWGFIDTNSNNSVIELVTSYQIVNASGSIYLLNN